MTLEPGARLGHYEIVGPLGAGGMGEVYRAHDPRLRRDVAIKILSDEVREDTQRRERFIREAETVAGLTHPHICVLHDIGQHEGTDFLVMELLEGETLAQRLKQGPLPLAEALRYGAQIADALATAHRAGVVHRDLKPANIMLTKAGPKLLDFGLAKLKPPAGTGESSTHLEELTAEGTILGTLQYMAPEQLEGRPTDARADIFAFGAVLHEMLTGRKAFTGVSQASLIGAILHTNPPAASSLQPLVPVSLDRLVRTCLEKDPDARWQSAADLTRELTWSRDDSAASPSGTAPAPTAGKRLTGRGRRALHVAGSAVGVVALTFLAYWAGTRTFDPAATGAGGRQELELSLPRDASLAAGPLAPRGNDMTVLALSPDGAELVYVGATDGGTRLFRRPLAGGEAEPIPDTDGATHPFFSPDGQWIGFLTADRVKKVAFAGGTVMTLCEALNPTVATWTDDGHIYFTEDGTYTLSRVDANGKLREPVAGQAVGRRYGAVLPDGRGALVEYRPANISFDFGDIQVVSLDTETTTTIVQRGYGARYIEPGYLLFGRSGDLYAVPFDLDTQTKTGDEVLVQPDVRMDSFFGQIQLAASATGMIVTVPGGDLAVGRPAWVDRMGNTEWLSMEEALYGSLDLSPDGRRVALHVADVRDRVYLYDVDQERTSKLGTDASVGWPVWSPDASELAYMQQDPDGGRRVLVENPDAPDTPRVLATGEASIIFVTWHPVENMVALSENDQGRGIGYVPSDRRIGDTRGWDARFRGAMPEFSPDGRHIAYYTAERSGRYEIYVRGYPDDGEFAQVSFDGGAEARWCTACNALFFRRNFQFFMAPMQDDAGRPFGPPQAVFEVEEFIDTVGPSFDVAADGSRILVIKRPRTFQTDTLTVLQNWVAATTGG